MIKKFLISIFGKEAKIIKFLAIIYFAYKNLIKIMPLVKKNKLIFLFVTVKSQIIIFFLPNILEKKIYFNKKYTFTYGNWFGENYYVWYKFLKNSKEINYLEIGSFEGRSAALVGEMQNVKQMTCVDTFSGSDEHKDINFDIVYNNCKQNLNKLKPETNLIKDTSNNFFSKNNKKFNVIYIDGSHFADDVKNDFINAMDCLEINGILICDDFNWFYYKNVKDNPICAILECYYKYKKNLKILFINHQIIFKKIN